MTQSNTAMSCFSQDSELFATFQELIHPIITSNSIHTPMTDITKSGGGEAYGQCEGVCGGDGQGDQPQHRVDLHLLLRGICLSCYYSHLCLQLLSMFIGRSVTG